MGIFTYWDEREGYDKLTPAGQLLKTGWLLASGITGILCSKATWAFVGAHIAPILTIAVFGYMMFGLAFAFGARPGPSGEGAILGNTLGAFALGTILGGVGLLLKPFVMPLLNPATTAFAHG